MEISAERKIHRLVDTVRVTERIHNSADKSFMTNSRRELSQVSNGGAHGCDTLCDHGFLKVENMEHHSEWYALRNRVEVP